MNFCTVNNKSICYKIINKEILKDGIPLIIFLHEGLGSIAQWKDFPAMLAEKLKFPALIYERYGHGNSDMLREKREVTFLMKEGTLELPALLKTLKINNELILIGHSDGGTIALYYASAFTERVKCVISEAAHVFTEDVSKRGIRQTIELYKQGRLRELIKRYHGEKADSMFYGWADTWLMREMEDWNMFDELKKIVCPVLAVQGEDDEYGSPEQVDLIVKYSGGETEAFMIPGCGHNPHHQHRERIIDKMYKFIKNSIK